MISKEDLKDVKSKLGMKTAKTVKRATDDSYNKKPSSLVYGLNKGQLHKKIMSGKYFEENHPSGKDYKKSKSKVLNKIHSKLADEINRKNSTKTGKSSYKHYLEQSSNIAAENRGGNEN